LKFSQGLEVKIVVNYDWNKSLLRVYVKDKGKGITEDEMEKLFKLFGKIKRTETDNYDGIGMGLNICQKIIKHNGGTIDVYSEGENLGSTFMFTMPMTVYEKKRSRVSEGVKRNRFHLVKCLRELETRIQTIAKLRITSSNLVWT